MIVKPTCVPSHKRLKITLLNSLKTDDSLPVSTQVTPYTYYDSDNSRVQVRIKVSFDLCVSYSLKWRWLPTDTEMNSCFSIY